MLRHFILYLWRQLSIDSGHELSIYRRSNAMGSNPIIDGDTSVSKESLQAYSSWFGERLWSGPSMFIDRIYTCIDIAKLIDIAQTDSAHMSKVRRQ